MAADDFEFGVLKGCIEEPYAKLCSQLTGDDNNMVGLYYRENNHTSISLFRSFDGTSINYFSHGITLNKLAEHHLVKSLTTYSFDANTWEVDHPGVDKSDLLNRFRLSFSRSLMSSMFVHNYDKFIMQIFSNRKERIEPIFNGYYRVNDIVLITCGLDTLNRWGSMHRDIVECRYLQLGVLLDCTKEIKYQDGGSDKVRTESEERMTKLAQSFIKVYLSNPELFTLPGSGTSGHTGESESQDKYKSTENMRVAMIEIRRTLDILFTEGTGGSGGTDPAEGTGGIDPHGDALETINISNLQYNFNLLSRMIGIPQIELCPDEFINKTLIFKYAVLPKTSTSSNVTLSHIKVPLKCGSKVIIPISGTELNKFSEDELNEILRYLLSLNKTSNPMDINILIDNIVVELALRSK